ncbi:MAG: hypothetical protein D6689_06180 [Deltaproteobacteria bacterium]|nr:MAG: hypothetical protein D6689_06180 [Deltaproteobacteria bacterium]
MDTGTFGETVATLVCKRIAYLEDLAAYEAGRTDRVDVAGDRYRDECRLGLPFPVDAPDRLHALHAVRDDLVAAIDATFPESFLPDLQTLLTSDAFLALYDDGTVDAGVDALIGTLDLLAADGGFTAALERFNHRLGYLPAPPALGAARALVRYPGLHDLLLHVTTAITPGGSASDAFDATLAAASAVLRNAEPAAVPSDPDRTGALAVDLLLTESPLLGVGRPLPLVRRDRRGLALVAPEGGELPEPFVDMDADGLADADALGRFVDADGQPIAAPTPFALPDGAGVPWPHRDALGRALTADDAAPLYQFVDLDRTLLAALARDSLQLLDPDRGTALDLVRGMAPLIGPRTATSRTYAGGDRIDYTGFDSSESPLLDVLYGYATLLTDPNVYDVLELARQLFRDHEAETARLVEALIRTARLADGYPDAELEPGSPLYDDLMPVIAQIVQTPGLTEDLLRALEAPEVAELGLRFAEQMTYKDRFDLDSETQQVVGSFATPVDRDAPDSGFNRSLFQRILHLIHDANGARLCNKQGAVIRDPILGIPIATYDECELLRIDDLAVFYVQSIAYAKDAAGNVIYDNIDGVPTPRPKARFPFTFNNALISAIVNDDLLESESGIEGFRFHPTPQALNRALFLDPMPAFLADAMDPARCNEGDRFIDAHAGSLLVWELNDFYDQVRPIAQAFADHDAEHLFVELLSVLHEHYPSRASTDHQQADPNGKGYAFASDIVSYEPLLIDLLERRDLLDALVYGAPVVNGMTVNGRPSVDVLADAARFLVVPRAGLTDRYGQTATETEDGRPVAELSPWYLLADAHKRKRAALAEAGSAAAAWREAISELVDVLLRGDAVVGVGWRFRNPRLRGVTVALIDYVEARLRAHDAAGDRDDWLLRDLPQRVDDLVTGPLLAAGADLIAALDADPAARRDLEAALAYLVDEVGDEDVFWTSVAAAADILQLALDDRDIVPIARALGEVLRPERHLITPQLVFARDARAGDETRALAGMLENLFVEHRPGHTAVGDILDAITEVNRARPWEDLGEPYRADDYRAALSAVAEFLGEERRGLHKFIEIIRSRRR